jgi:hypothetical protein
MQYDDTAGLARVFLGAAVRVSPGNSGSDDDRAAEADSAAGGGGDGSIIGKRQIWSCSGAGRQGMRAGVRPTTEHSAATHGARTTDRTEGYESVWKGLPSPRAPYVPLVTR